MITIRYYLNLTICSANNNIGVAEFHETDKYNKIYGRKLAFTRAIAHLERKERIKLWKKFKKSFQIMQLCSS